MNTNSIIDGISIKLDELFEEGYTIYTNSIKQELEMPCFFIKVIKSDKKRLVGKRMENTDNLVIHVILEDDSVEKLNDISDKLYNLEYITLLDEDIVRGYDMRTEISDGVLLFFITYKYFTYEESIKENEMVNLTEKGEIKSG